MQGFPIAPQDPSGTGFFRRQ